MLQRLEECCPCSYPTDPPAHFNTDPHTHPHLGLQAAASFAPPAQLSKQVRQRTRDEATLRKAGPPARHRERLACGQGSVYVSVAAKHALLCVRESSPEHPVRSSKQRMKESHLVLTTGS
jgi:hypothetical protein